jgi:hypothetical protein
MSIIPFIPNSPPFAREAEPEPEPDLTVYDDRAAILKAIDEKGRIYQMLDRDFAVGPGNLRYSTKVLTEMSEEGIVSAVDSLNKPWNPVVFAKFIASPEAQDTGVDDDGVENNSYPSALVWIRTE